MGLVADVGFALEPKMISEQNKLRATEVLRRGRKAQETLNHMGHHFGKILALLEEEIGSGEQSDGFVEAADFIASEIEWCYSRIYANIRRMNDE